MDYTDLYQTLNPHLFLRHRQVSPPGRDIPIKINNRNKINIVIEKDRIASAVSNVFGFSSAIFKDHQYAYPIQEMTGTGDFINVSYRWSTEYYHFLTEALPSAMFCASKLPPETPIVCGHSRFAEGFFRWFGLSNPIRFETRGGGFTAKYVECGNPSHDTIQRLRHVIESKVEFTQTKGILLRRHDSRYLENEAEVLSTFQSLYPKLEWVVYDVLPAAETATLFASAAVIVGPHGAGLTNMIFSARGIRIYEFMPNSQPNLCYTHLSSLLGNTYTMIPVNAYAPKFSMKPSLRSMYIMNNFGQIRIDQPFGKWIEAYAKDTRFQRYMEIGSWNGKGSTICFGMGFLDRNDSAILHSFEINQDRYVESSEFWQHNPRIKIHNARILPELPDVRAIHSSIQTDWQADDERWFKTTPYVDAVALQPEVVLLDGGEYITYFEYQLLKPHARVFLLDDTAVDKCKRIVEELSADPQWKHIASGKDRNGWAVFQRN